MITLEQLYCLLNFTGWRLWAVLPLGAKGHIKNPRLYSYYLEEISSL
jgi:hypothetical protein